MHDNQRELQACLTIYERMIDRVSRGHSADNPLPCPAELCTLDTECMQTIQRCAPDYPHLAKQFIVRNDLDIFTPDDIMNHLVQNKVYLAKAVELAG